VNLDALKVGGRLPNSVFITMYWSGRRAALLPKAGCSARGNLRRSALPSMSFNVKSVTTGVKRGKMRLEPGALIDLAASHPSSDRKSQSAPWAFACPSPKVL
jgi:hypothetical protein